MSRARNGRGLFWVDDLARLQTWNIPILAVIGQYIVLQIACSCVYRHKLGNNREIRGRQRRVLSVRGSSFCTDQHPCQDSGPAYLNLKLSE